MNASFTQAMVENQVLGARTKITACGIPQADIVGFRQPFLESNPTVRQVRRAPPAAQSGAAASAAPGCNRMHVRAPPPTTPASYLQTGTPHVPADPATHAAGAEVQRLLVRQHNPGGGHPLHLQRHGRPHLALHAAGWHPTELRMVSGHEAGK